MTRATLSCAVAASALALAACAEPTPAPEETEAAAALPLPTRIVDLSPTVTEDLPLRTWGPAALAGLGLPESTEFDVRVIDEPLHLSISLMTLLIHAGPHADAPIHFEAGATAVDAMPLEQFVGPLRVLDFRSTPKDEAISREAIAAHPVEPGDVVILMVDYTPATGPEEMPSYAYLSPEAAEHLASIPVRAFGTSGFSVDSFKEATARMADGVTGYAPLFPVHQAFLGRDIPIIEGIVNVEEVANEERALFVGLPLKIAGGDAGPMRAAAFVY